MSVESKIKTLPQDELMPLRRLREVFKRGEAALEPTKKELQPFEQVKIDLSSPLADDKEMDAKLDIDGKLVAIVEAGSKNFMIVDKRGTGINRDFLITDDSFSKENKTGYKGVMEGKPVVVGRGHDRDRFDNPDEVSRDHFEVLYQDGNLFIRNLVPKNKTFVTAYFVSNPHPENQNVKHIIDSSRTQAAQKRMLENPNFGEKDDTAPYGYYLNHPIIGRASQAVDGGVYLGGSAREAIVVDGKSAALKQIYESFESELKQTYANNETLPLGSILLKVMKRVQEVMPYDATKTDAISQNHYGDQLVGLSTYVNKQAGVCRHQGLLAAYLLENLIKDGHIAGSIGVERNTVEDMGGTHAWAVYKLQKDGQEQVIVVDPAQSFVGTKEQAEREGRWEYRLATNDYKPAAQNQ